MHCRPQTFFFLRLLLVLILLVTVGFFPTSDLSKRSLETVLLHLSFWPVAPFCISFSSIPPQISLTLQSPLALWEHSLTIFLGSCSGSGLRQSLLQAIHSCLFDILASVLAQLLCSVMWWSRLGAWFGWQCWGGRRGTFFSCLFLWTGLSNSASTGATDGDGWGADTDGEMCGCRAVMAYADSGVAVASCWAMTGSQW